jgi:hypothetical protein
VTSFAISLPDCITIVQSPRTDIVLASASALPQFGRTVRATDSSGACAGCASSYRIVASDPAQRAMRRHRQSLQQCGSSKRVLAELQLKQPTTRLQSCGHFWLVTPWSAQVHAATSSLQDTAVCSHAVHPCCRPADQPCHRWQASRPALSQVASQQTCLGGRPCSRGAASQ